MCVKSHKDAEDRAVEGGLATLTQGGVENPYYAHVKNCHPQERHSVKVLDPMLDNPNSKLNILALCHHVYKVANIEKDKDENGNSRQWTFIAADAAIANQVTYIQSTPA